MSSRPARPRRHVGGRLRWLRHALALAKRSLIKTLHTPEALIDVTLQPIIFLLLFTYVFGGAISGGSQHDYLQYLLPGLLGQGIAMAGVALGQNLNADIEKGVFDRFRSLPIARSAPLVGAVLADVARYFILCSMFLGFGYVIGFRVTTNPLACDRRDRHLDRVRAVLLLDLGVHRHDRPHVRAGAGNHVLDRLAVVVRQQRVRQHLDVAWMVAGVREGQPHLAPGGHGPGADVGGPGAE